LMLNSPISVIMFMFSLAKVCKIVVMH